MVARHLLPGVFTMKEFLELRVMEEFAYRFFVPDEGARGRIGIARRVVIPTDDPRLPAMIDFQRELNSREDRRLFIGSWQFIRKYSAADLRAAELFHLHIAGTVYPAGEDCGTIYDPGSACPICALGAQPNNSAFAFARFQSIWTSPSRSRRTSGS